MLARGDGYGRTQTAQAVADAASPEAFRSEPLMNTSPPRGTVPFRHSTPRAQPPARNPWMAQAARWIGAAARISACEPSTRRRAMRRVMVRYRVRPDQAAANEQL